MCNRQTYAHRVCWMIDKRFPLLSGHIMHRRLLPAERTTAMRQKQVSAFEVCLLLLFG